MKINSEIETVPKFFFLYLRRLAEELRPFENASATHIQRLFRGTRIRIEIKIKRYVKDLSFSIIKAMLIILTVIKLVPNKTFAIYLWTKVTLRPR